MQTFLPFEDFKESARCLDRQRLGKQRVEAWQILNALMNGSGWAHHPAVKMWAGAEWWLCCYGVDVCKEWIRRGYRDTMLQRFEDIVEWTECLELTTYPWWLGNKSFHASHRAALLAKNVSWYGQFGWLERPVIDYVWPRRNNGW